MGLDVAYAVAFGDESSIAIAQRWRGKKQQSSISLERQITLWRKRQSAFRHNVIVLVNVASLFVDLPSDFFPKHNLVLWKSSR